MIPKLFLCLRVIRSLSVLDSGKFPFVQPIGLGMGPDLIVGGDVDLVPDALDPGGVDAVAVPEDRLHPGLVQGYPELDL